MLVLVTGATGKVGRVLLQRMLEDPRCSDMRVRAFIHNRTLPPHERLEVIRGSITDGNVVAEAIAGATHVIHMATVKEDPQHAMDVSAKGMFLLLDAFRTSATAEQFILVGGDCVVGHIHVAYDAPITEISPRRPYPGVYALSKVLEEVMLEQFYIQYGINGCCLRAPWIMEKDDFKYVLTFGADQFGGPDWDTLMSAATRARHHREGAVPLLLDIKGQPLERNFIHVTDVVAAILAALDHPGARQQLFNVAMNRPLDYAVVAEHLARTRQVSSVAIETSFHSNWLDNSKARQALGWEPQYDAISLVDAAFSYARAADDPRKVWYVG